MWALMLRVGRSVVVGHSSGCRCPGDHVSLQLRASTVARVNGGTWWDSQFVSGRSREKYGSVYQCCELPEL